MFAACGPAATTQAPTTAVEQQPEVPAAPTEAAVEPTDVMEEPTEAVTEAPTEAAGPSGPADATLLIWADDTRTPILLDLAEEFRSEYNVEVIVEDLGRVQDIRTPMITAAPAGEGPDIFIGVHDWLGALVESGLVAPIERGNKESEFVDLALEAFTYTDCQLYGVPYATENLGFFYA